MKTRLLILLFLLIPTFNIFSQGSISGRIIDTATGDPLRSASVTILSTRDSSVVKGDFTKNEGNFTIDEIPYGEYILKATFVSYETHFEAPLTLSRGNKNINLETIELMQQSFETEGVEVVADRNQLQTSFDKRIINVEKSIITAGGTALDVLRNTPTVNVDQDGNVSIRGGEGVRILIDGKERAGASSSDILDLISANSIERIELMTNPSARYEAEGSSGIINLVLKHNRQGGFNGNFTLSAGTGDKYNAGANLNYKVNDWNYMLNYNFRDHRRSGDIEFLTERYLNDTLIIDQTGDNYRDRLVHDLNPGIDYNLTRNDRFSLNSSIRYSQRGRYSSMASDQSGAVDPNRAYYTSIDDDLSDDVDFDASLSYRHLFNNKGHDLVISQVYTSEVDRETDLTENYYFSSPLDEDINEFSRWKSQNDEFGFTYDAQIDYILPLDNGIKLEFGSKYSMRDIEFAYDFYNYDMENTDWILDESQINNYNYNEDIGAAYAIFADSLSKFKLQVGLRGEYTIQSGLQEVGNKSFDKNYFDLFPTAHVSYLISPLHTASISYTRRINRPRSWFLNPNEDFMDSLNVRVGNPELSPEYINSFEIGSEHYMDAVDVFLTGFYRVTQDEIDRYRRLRPDGVIEHTFLNIAEEESFGAELVLQKNFGKWLRLSSDLSYYKFTVRSDIEGNEINNTSNVFTGRLNSTVSITKDFSLQAMINYRSPRATAQGEMYEIYYVDLGARYELFNRKLQIFARMSDVFDTFRYKFDIDGGNYISSNVFNRESQVFILGVNYRLNSRQMPNRERGENGEMDDFY